MARAGLTRESVVATAIAIADADGIKALTMRALAAELGVEAMSLYNHVSNKADLESAIADRIWSDVDTAADEPDWRLAIERMAVSTRRAVVAHPWFFQLSALLGGLARVTIIDAQLAHMRRGGLDPRAAYHLQHVLDAHIMGFAWLDMEYADDTETTARAAEALGAIPEGELEDLKAHAALHFEGAPEGSGFELGLRMILDGFAARES